MTRVMFGLVLTVVGAGAMVQETGMTLDEALALARERQPVLAAAGFEAVAAEENAEQAGAWSNPEVFFKLEGAPRAGDAWRGANRVVGLSQAVPWNGRPGAERRVADAVAERMAHERELALQKTRSTVRAAFAEALHAREALALAVEGVDVARRLHDLVVRRVEAGDAPMVNLRRARMELGAARAEVARRRTAEATARMRLAIAVGIEPAEVTGVRGHLTVEPAVPAIDDLLADLDATPRSRIAGAEVAGRNAAVDAASRSRWPDLAVEAGLRSTPDGDAFDAGVSLRVPLFDRGGARTSAARATAAAAGQRALAARRELVAAVHQAHAELAESVASAVLYDDVVVPEATAALRAAEAAYAAGDADLTGTLQITRDWLAARMVRLDALLAAERARAKLVGLL